MRLVARKLQRIGVGGACIEDKIFPKTNSFIDSHHALADMAEFCGRIKAAKDTAGDDLFVVARCEALVAGRPLTEALDRCGIYTDCGADAIPIHSKKTIPDEILDFMSAWGGQAPVAIVPTKYSKVPADVFEQAGVSVAIWANQSLRAAIAAMQCLCAALREQRTRLNLEDDIVELSRVFELANNAELDVAKEHYSRYVPSSRAKAVTVGDARVSADRHSSVPPVGKVMTNGSTNSDMADSVRDVIRLHHAWSNRPHSGDPVADLIRHLRSNVPFYRESTAGDLADLPVVDRALYAERVAAFRSTVSTAPHILRSSGSTGEPLTITLDDAAWYAVNYDFFARICLLADLPVSELRAGELAVLFVSNKPGRSSFVRPLPSLNYGLYARIQLSAAANVASVYERLRAIVLYGKPTYLLDLRSVLLDCGFTRPPWSPRMLLVSGESLHEDDRQRLTDYFAAPIVDALASTEGGLIAATRPDGDPYHVFSENVLLEVLTEDGTARQVGVGELLLTNLLYRDTVFVRYRTGDHAELDTDGDGTQRLLRLWGQEPRTLKFRARQLPTRALTARLGFLPGMGDFQVVTAPEQTVLRWVPDVGHPDLDVVHRGLRIAVDDLLPDEDVQFERCERITPLGDKKRRFR